MSWKVGATKSILNQKPEFFLLNLKNNDNFPNTSQMLYHYAKLLGHLY
jgi:hypothetical protein